MTYPRTSEDGWPGDPVEFGQLLRDIRKLLGVSRQALVDVTGIPWPTLRNIEQGKHGTSPENRKKLIGALMFHPFEPSHRGGKKKRRPLNRLPFRAF